MRILVLNCGSSSLKFRLLDLGKKTEGVKGKQDRKSANLFLIMPTLSNGYLRASESYPEERTTLLGFRR